MGEFDIEIATRRLTMIAELLGELEKMSSTDASVLRRDPMTRYAVERILTLLVDLATGLNSHLLVTRIGAIPETARDSFIRLADAGVLNQELAERLAPSVGMRNLLIHQYADVDLNLVAAAVVKAHRDYSDYLRALAAYINS